MTELLELAWSSATDTQPLESSERIMEILGYICFFGTVFYFPVYAHFILLKSDIPSQVSSTLITVFFSKSSFRKPSAKCYLRIRFLLLLPCHEMDLIRLYLMFSSSFMTFLMTNGFTSMSWSSFSMVLISLTLPTLPLNVTWLAMMSIIC